MLRHYRRREPSGKCGRGWKQIANIWQTMNQRIPASPMVSAGGEQSTDLSSSSERWLSARRATHRSVALLMLTPEQGTGVPGDLPDLCPTGQEVIQAHVPDARSGPPTAPMVEPSGVPLPRRSEPGHHHRGADQYQTPGEATGGERIDHTECAHSDPRVSREKRNFAAVMLHSGTDRRRRWARTIGAVRRDPGAIKWTVNRAQRG